MNGRGKDIMHAGVMPLPGFLAERQIKVIRVLPGKLPDCLDFQHGKVYKCGLADVAQAGETPVTIRHSRFPGPALLTSPVLLR